VNPIAEVLRTMARVALTALVVWREARNESYKCKLAVAYVVRSRVRKPGGWGHDVLGVLFHPWAFSSVTDPKDPQLTRWPVEGSAAWDECLLAAERALFELEPNPTPDAVFYHSFPKVDPPREWGPVQLVAKLDSIWFFKQ
jgi:spore germination cell wall hydrolase CwlJ-like protein